MTTNARAIRRNLGGGFSIPAAAQELGWPEYTLRGAVKRHEVKTDEINGLHRIPPSEIARLKALFGTSVASEEV